MQISPAWRAALAGGSVHLVMGANLPYLPVWMEQVGGMSGAEIAGAGTLATLVRIIAGPIAAGIAQERGLRATLSAAMLVTLSGFLLLFPESPRIIAFLLCLMVYLSLGVAGPLFEALLVYGTRGARPDYGEARAFSSSCFVIANLAGGAILGAFGPKWVLGLLACMSLLATIAPLYTKRGARDAVPRRSTTAIFSQGIGLYRIEGVFAFITAAALIQASHGAYYAFASNLWIAQGIDGSQIGALWAIGVVAEVIFLLLSGRYLKHVSPTTLLLVGGAGAIVRWLAAGIMLPTGAIYAFQLLHAASFAMTHIGTLRFLDQKIPDAQLPLSYAVNSALVFGPLIALSGFVAGLAYDALAPGGVSAQIQVYWIMSVIALMGLVLTLWTGRSRNAKA